MVVLIVSETVNNPNKYVVKLRNYNTNNLLFKYATNIIFNVLFFIFKKKKKKKEIVLRVTFLDNEAGFK